jgi:6-phosphogluconolactonase
MIQVYPDLESLSRAAAALLLRQAHLAVTARGRFSVALPGGATPRRTYELLAQPPFLHQAPWDRMHVFWGDERCVPLDDPRSNARLAKETWLDLVPIPPDQIHPLHCAPDPTAAARHYETELRQFFGDGPPCLDLVFLGLGTDGHTASLFPGTPVLAEKQRWAAEVQVAAQDFHRVTLTAPLINQAVVVAFLVAGGAKADILRDVLRGPREPARLPAQLIQPQNGDLLWLVDLAAAGRLAPDGSPFRA